MLSGTSINVRHNEGYGIFGSSTPTVVGDSLFNIVGLTVTDIDRDFRTEIIAGFDGEIRVYADDGTGAVYEMGSLILPGSGYADNLVAADRDGDGFPELFAANGNEVLVIDNTGGVLSYECSVAISDFIRTLKATDLDGSGQPDLLIGHDGGSSVMKWEGAACANATVSSMTTITQPVLAAGADDLNGDGYVDVIGAGRALGQSSVDRLWTWTVNPASEIAGPFAERTGFSMTGPLGRKALANLNGNGSLDAAIIANSQLSVVSKDWRGGSLITSPPLGLGPAPTDLAIGDLDADGALDVVVAGSTLIRLFNDGTGSLSDPGGHPSFGSNLTAVALEDLDADGDLDAVVSDEAGDVHVAVNDGAGQLTEQSSLASVGAVGSLQLTDVDSDGDTDVLAFETDLLNVGTVQMHVLLNDGLGGLQLGDTVDLSLGRDAYNAHFAVGDLDGDGLIDIVVLGTGTTLSFNEGIMVSSYLGNAAGAFDPQPVYEIATDRSLDLDASALALIDVDRDGDLDALLNPTNRAIGPVSVDTNDVLMMLNDGAGHFSPPQELIPPGVSDVVKGDLDGDGIEDLLRASSGGSFRMLLGSGLAISAGTFSQNVGAAIPDDGSPLSSSMRLAAQSFDTLQVQVTVDHPRTEDLEIHLDTPGCIGGSPASFLLKPVGTALAGSGMSSLNAGVSLADAMCNVAAGPWTLTVSDAVSGESGTLRGWSVVGRQSGGNHPRLASTVRPRAGLVATFWDTSSGQPVLRWEGADPRPWGTWDAATPPRPGVSSSSFEVEWRGYLRVPYDRTAGGQSYTFRVETGDPGDHVTLEVGGALVFDDATGATAYQNDPGGQPVLLGRGEQPIRLRFSHTTDATAAVVLFASDLPVDPASPVITPIRTELLGH